VLDEGTTGERKSGISKRGVKGRVLGFDLPNICGHRVLLPDGQIRISRSVEFDKSVATATVTTTPLISDVANEQMQVADDLAFEQNLAAEEDPAPVPNENLVVMNENALYQSDDEEAPDDDDGDDVPQMNHSDRPRKSIVLPYDKYLHGLPGANALNFRQ
jgi:hypothetical protein